MFSILIQVVYSIQLQPTPQHGGFQLQSLLAPSPGPPSSGCRAESPARGGGGGGGEAADVTVRHILFIFYLLQVFIQGRSLCSLLTAPHQRRLPLARQRREEGEGKGMNNAAQRIYQHCQVEPQIKFSG